MSCVKNIFEKKKNQDHMLTSLNQEINKIWQIAPKSRSNYNHIPSQTNHLLIRINIWCIKNFDNHYRITRTLNIYSYVLINKDKLKNEKKTYLFGFGRYYIQLPFHMLISDRSIEIKMIQWQNKREKKPITIIELHSTFSKQTFLNLI